VHAWRVLEKFGIQQASGPHQAIVRNQRHAIMGVAMPRNDLINRVEAEKVKALANIDPTDERAVVREGRSLSVEQLHLLLAEGSDVGIMMLVNDLSPDSYNKVHEVLQAYLVYTGQAGTFLAGLKEEKWRLEMGLRLAEKMTALNRRTDAAVLLRELIAGADPQAVIFYKINMNYNLLVKMLDLMKKLAPDFAEKEGLALIMTRYQELEAGPENDALLVNAGFLYRPQVAEPAAVQGDPLTAQLLRLGAIVRESSRQSEEQVVSQLQTYWSEQKKLPAAVRARVIEQLYAKRHLLPPLAGQLIELLKKTGDLTEEGILRARVEGALAKAGIDGQELTRRLDNEPEFRALLPEIYRLASRRADLWRLAHLFNGAADVALVAELNNLSEEQLACRFVDSGRPLARRIIWQLLRGNGQIDELLANDPEFLAAATALTKDPTVAEELRREVEERCLAYVQSRFHDLIGRNGSADQLAEKVAGLARECAGLAHKALDLTRQIAGQTKRPTINIYILSTAHGFNAERILGDLYQNAPARQVILGSLRKSKRDHLAKEVEKLGMLPDGPDRVEAEMRVIHRLFFRQIDELLDSRKLDRLSAVMEVGERWLKLGLLRQFTYPLEIKVPSGSQIPGETVKQLEALSRQAAERGWDIVLIDHSTVRTKDVVHQGDPPESEKGRAIARAMEAICRAVAGAGQKAASSWLYKNNGWQIDPASIAPEKGTVRVIGLNLYDGKVYDQHVWGKKDDWVGIDDHGKTILGVEVGKGNAREMRSVVGVARATGGGLKRFSVSRHYWEEFRREAARLEGWPPTMPSFKVNNLLFVCNANHHRSTTMEHLFRHLLREQLGPDAEKMNIRSGGIEADDYVGQHPDKKTMSARARHMLTAQGITVNGSAKNQLTPAEIDNAELIIVMTRREAAALKKKIPASAQKIQVLKEFLGYPQAEQDLPTPGEFDAQTFGQFKKLAEQLLDKIVV
jgi:protein-tyrosine-phosphatase